MSVESRLYSYNEPHQTIDKICSNKISPHQTIDREHNKNKHLGKQENIQYNFFYIVFFLLFFFFNIVGDIFWLYVYE